MLSALSSLIWGTEEDTTNIAQTTNSKETCTDEHVEVENEWIFIQQREKSLTRKPRRRAAHFDDGTTPNSEANAPGMEESWLVTPPQCFSGNLKRPRSEVSPMENLLIEHPSMSIYHGNEEPIKEEEEETSKDLACVPARRDTHKAVAGRLLVLEKRHPLKDLNLKSSDRKHSSPKNVKRRNQVYVRQNGARKNKQYGRMSGKHTAMVAKRGS